MDSVVIPGTLPKSLYDHGLRNAQAFTAQQSHGGLLDTYVRPHFLKHRMQNQILAL